MTRRLTTAMAVLVASVLLARCSWVVGDFTECDAESPCTEGRVCQEGFCVVPTTPQGCSGNPDAGLAAAYGALDAGNAIHLGASLALTNRVGEPSDIDLQELNAMRLALEEINQRSGVGGRPFVLHVCDYASVSERAATQVAWLADEVGAPAVFVTNSGAVLASAQETNSRGVLLVSSNATSTELSALHNPDGGVRLVWRTAPSDALQGGVINDLLTGASSYDAGLATVTKVAIAYVNDPYGQGLSAILLAGLTGKTVQAFQFEGGGDLGALMAQLETFAPQLTVVIAFPEDASRIVAAAQGPLSRASGHRWFFTDAAKDPSVVHAETEGAYGTAPAKGAGPEYTVFANSFQSRFGANPQSYAFIEHDYDALYVTALGAAYALGADGTGVLSGSRMAEGLTRLSSGTSYGLGPSQFANARAALAAGTSVDVAGASGLLQFDPATGEAPGSIELWQVDAGTLRVVTRIDPP